MEKRKPQTKQNQNKSNQKRRPLTVNYMFEVSILRFDFGGLSVFKVSMRNEFMKVKFILNKDKSSYIIEQKRMSKHYSQTRTGQFVQTHGKYHQDFVIKKFVSKKVIYFVFVFFF